MRGDAVAAEDVDDDEVGGAVQTAGQPPEHLASVAVAHPDRRAAGQRQLRADQVDERRLELDHLLPRTRPRGLDVPGEREGAGAEVQRRDRLARHPQLVDHVAHAGDVLEEEVRRIVEVDVRLRGAVDDELEGARHETVGSDDGAHPVGEPGRALLIHPDIVSRRGWARALRSSRGGERADRAARSSGSRRGTRPRGAVLRR